MLVHLLVQDLCEEIRVQLRDSSHPLTAAEALDYINRLCFCSGVYCSLLEMWVFRQFLPDGEEKTVHALIACIVNVPSVFFDLLTTRFLLGSHRHLLEMWLSSNGWTPFPLLNTYLGPVMQNMRIDMLFKLLTTRFRHPNQADSFTTVLDIWISDTLHERYDHSKIAGWIRMAVVDPRIAYSILTYTIDPDKPSLFQKWYTGTLFPSHLNSHLLASLLIAAKTQMPEKWQAYIQPGGAFSYRCAKWCFAGLAAASMFGTVIMPVLWPYLLGTPLSPVWFYSFFIGLASVTVVSGVISLVLVGIQEKYSERWLRFPASNNGTSVDDTSVERSPTPSRPARAFSITSPVSILCTPGIDPDDPLRLWSDVTDDEIDDNEPTNNHSKLGPDPSVVFPLPLSPSPTPSLCDTGPES